MRRTLANTVLILLLTLFVQNLFAQKIAINNQSIAPEGFIAYDLGQYKKGKKQTLWLEIKNDSKKSLQIKSLELSCDCLSASALPPMALPPGALYRLKIIHKAKDIGSFQTFIIVRSDAQNHPELWLKLNGEVLKKKSK